MSTRCRLYGGRPFQIPQSRALALCLLLLAAISAQAQAAPVAYVQGNSATPQTPQATVTVNYTLAQTAGNLNVVVVGWNDSTATVSTVTDSKGNSYGIAAAPVVQSGTASQAIYYAKNIVAAAAGTNTVTVTFSVAARFADVRIAEYSGLDTVNPLDVAAGAQGNSATSNSGSMATTNANDLLLGANLVQSTTTGAGTNYTKRVITPDGDILEDRIVTTTASYGATAALDKTQPWIMQMVAFRAASGGGGTTPNITSLNPTSGSVTTAVTISGSNFGASQGTSTVRFNGTTATPTNWTGTSIVVPVPAGATTGNVVVTVGGVASNGVNFTVTVPPPSITSLTPNSGGTGTPVTIAGSNFGAAQGASTVKFNGTTATPTNWTATSVTAPVPAGAATGNVVVTVGGVASNALLFTVPPPSITSLTPNSGTIGTPVTIGGANFGATQGASTVTFNGVVAMPTSWNASSISVQVPNGATTGPVVVKVNAVASNGVSFTVTIPPPSISSLTPNSGAAGTTVTVAGSNFGAAQGSNTVTFNGVAATPTSWNISSISAPVPNGATTGSVVVTVGGVASNALLFTVPPPSITSLTPNSGAIGTSVTVAGANFGSTQGTSTVTFNGLAATPTSWNTSSIAVPVPNGTTTGPVVVTVNGVASNGVTFTVTTSPPSITTLTPNSGVIGTPVTIAGSNFGAAQGTSAVSFNGVTATPTNWSATSIVVSVPVGTTTGNVVVTVGGAASNGVNFALTNSPAYALSVSISSDRNPAIGLQGAALMGSNYVFTAPASQLTNASPAGITSVSYWLDNPAMTGSPAVTDSIVPYDFAGTASSGFANPLNTATIADGTHTITQLVSAANGLTEVDTATFTIQNNLSTVITSGHFEYVVTDQNLYAYNLDNNFQLVLHVNIPQAQGVRGAGAVPSTHMLYISYGGAGGSTGTGSLIKFDLLTNSVVWTQSYPFGVDCFSTTPDGTTIYMPDGADSTDGIWYVIDASSGAVTGSINTGMSGPHNTIVSLDGAYVFMGPIASNFLVKGVPGTNTVALNIGPLRPNVRPFTINGMHTLAFTTANLASGIGFQVSDTTSGSVLYTVNAPGFNVPPGFTDTPVHGISLSPDETEIYLIDTANAYVHVFNVSGLPSSAPVLAANIPLTTNFSGWDSPCFQAELCPREGWIRHTRDGHYVLVGDSGNVIDTTTRTVVNTIPQLLNSRHGNIEIDWQNGLPVSTTTHYGLGYVTSSGNPSAPSVTSLSPASGTIGTPVTVTGANFGSAQGTSTITFNGVAAAPTSWTATSIVVPAPTGATTGKVIVTVGGLASNGLTFTVQTVSTISFVQSNSATPQTPQTTVSLPYTASQTAGNLNVVAVGWNDSTATVVSVTDSKGNSYALAAPPILQSGTATQSIYYAKNIASAAANANTVTVTFTPAAKFPDVRIAEYSGIDIVSPLDQSVGAQGNSATSNSGSVTTSIANDLLIGANLVQSTTTGPGAGFTNRRITPDGDILEDRIVTATGSYAATAALDKTQPWIMQMVAFRAASSGGATPTAPSNLAATLVNPLQVNLSWTGSTEAGGTISQYLIERCQGTPCSAFAQIATSPTTTFSDTGLSGSTSYTYRVRAMDSFGTFSAYSNSASATTGLSISPRATDLTFTRTQQFTASAPASWFVDGVLGGSATAGTISGTGLYTPPSSVGNHTVSAQAQSQSANAIVYVTNYPGTFMRDNDVFRTGQNLAETVLTSANVNSSQFGKLLSYSIDGVSDASPLYVANVSIPGQGFHNVVYVETEHDSVYAFDAEGLSANPLWKVSFINPAAGITTITPSDTGDCCPSDMPVEAGITGTPVIDQASGTLYVVAVTKEVSGSTTKFVQRLHALDISTGAEKLGGPVMIQASIPGTGDGSSGGQLSFDALRENQRAALLLTKGIVYIAWAGHADKPPYHGWVLGYNATTLQQVVAYNATPDGSGGGIWQSGDGLTTDSTGRIYFVTGNGLFDVNTGGRDYGDSVVALNQNGTVSDYFTPHDQSTMASIDLDLGSGGALLLPDQPGSHPHVALTAGKNGTIYVLDRDNMGHFNSATDNQILQSLVNIFPGGTFTTGNFKSPVYFNGHVYFSADADNLKAFAVTNGLLSTSPTSQTSLVAGYPGATLSISANGSTNGILWAVQRINTDQTGQGTVAPGILHAYDATNLAIELYNSNQAAGGRDGMDFAAKWAAPLVANGKVFVASNSQLAVYGLLP